MSPKIVNKEERRKELAFNAYEYLIVTGIENFTTNGLIKHLGIGKSSLYNYFESRDEIIQEIMYHVLMDYTSSMVSMIESEVGLKEKLSTIFEFYLVDSPEYKQGLQIYKEYLSTYFDSSNKKMVMYSEEMAKSWFGLIYDVIEAEVKKGHVKKEALHMANGLACAADGMLMYESMLEDFSLQTELKNYIENFITLVEV